MRRELTKIIAEWRKIEQAQIKYSFDTLFEKEEIFSVECSLFCFVYGNVCVFFLVAFLKKKKLFITFTASVSRYSTR